MLSCIHKKKGGEHLEGIHKAEVLQLFEAWADLAADKKIPDPHRFDTALVEWCKQRGYTVKSFNAPIFLVFAAFVGALDTLKELDANKKEKAPANK